MNDDVLELVPEDHPLLRTKLEPFDFDNPPVNPSWLADQLARAMLKYDGVGLAANQVGLPYRVFVIKANPIIAAFNPKILDTSEEKIYLEERCLTYPGLFVKIKRPRVIRVRYTLPNGDTNTYKYQDLTARIFQHEMDHLDGIVFTSRANPYHLEQAKKKRSR